MTELTLKDELMRDARDKGICAPGYGLMRVYDRLVYGAQLPIP